MLVNKLTYRFRPIDRGDVVVFRYPRDRSVNYIKRVVGVPGDRIEFRQGVLYINGERETAPDRPLPGKTVPETIVPDDSVYVLGDKRESSRDSREFGCVPTEDVFGAVEYIYYPPSRFGALEAREGPRDR